MTSSTVHASAVLIGSKGLLIRGPSGSGKSFLADNLLLSAARRGNYAALVADDRVRLVPGGRRLIAEGPQTIHGRLEVWGFGITEMPAIRQARVHLIVDLAEPVDMERLPENSLTIEPLSGVDLPRIVCPARSSLEAARLIRWALRTLFPNAPDYI